MLFYDIQIVLFLSIGIIISIYGLEKSKVFESVRVVTAKLSVIPSSVISGNHLVPSPRGIYLGLEPIVDTEVCSMPKFTKEYKMLKNKARCQPRETLVELSLDNAIINGTESNAGELFTAKVMPNVVVVKRCGGLCGNRKKCLSTEQTYKLFYVKTVKNGKMNCLSVEVAEDVKCRCRCETNRSQCHPNQTFDKQNCSCVCKNKDERSRCIHSKDNRKRWDNVSCSCSCKKRQLCTTGTVWSDEVCRCVRDNLTNFLR